VKKGQLMLIPIVAVNRDKSIWGEDANEFRQAIINHLSFNGRVFTIYL
jgi:hypothetical protein